MLRLFSSLRWPLLGATAAAFLILTPTALAGSGVGGVFNLGQSNTVNGPTYLIGSSAGPQLGVQNENAGPYPSIRGYSVSNSSNLYVIHGDLEPFFGTTGGGSAAVYGQNKGTNGNGYGVFGSNGGAGTGILGESPTGIGVWGDHTAATGTKPGVEGLSNSSTAPGVVAHNTAGGPALELDVTSNSIPPLRVGSQAKVANLNVDLLDGHDSAYFLPTTGTAANSTQLQGHAAAFFLPATGTAADSSKLAGKGQSFYQQRVSGTCVAGTAINAVNSDGTVTCQNTGGSGTVTSVDSGTGLTGGPITGSGTLSIASGYELPQSCAASQVPVADGSGGWTCGSGGGGGSGWSLTGNSGTTAGTNFLGTTDNTALELKVNSARALRLEPDATSPNIVGGEHDNTIKDGAHGATIAGGGYNEGMLGNVNLAYDNFDTIGGGYANHAGSSDNDPTTAPGATVAGGAGNSASATNAAVAGGSGNTAAAPQTAVGGGTSNHATGDHSTISGGQSNTASGTGAAIDGGESNTAGAADATVAGGSSNNATGPDSLAAGTRAKATQDGSFVWGDDTAQDLTAPGTNTFIVRATNGIWFGKNSGPYTPEAQMPAQFIGTSVGAYLSNSGVWTNSSDRAKKHDFRPLNKQSVLAKIARMPIGSWSYKVESPSVRHVGPMAQDFYSAFGLGADNTHITTIDEGGVALAAIQGLYRQNQTLRRELANQNARLTRLERALGKRASR